MSRETALARHDAEQAAHNWLGHRKHCPACDAAAARRRWDQLCRQGTGLHVAKRNADAELKRNRELDRQPGPDQEAMFP